MNSDAKTITPLPDYKLQVELADGRRGVFDVKPYLQIPALAALQDTAYFNRVSILFGAATWPDGEDIAPSTLSAELQTLQHA
jgi:Protein of unknown function (DUF2442)